MKNQNNKTPTRSKPARHNGHASNDTNKPLESEMVIHE
jgi:hypothetical protein